LILDILPFQALLSLSKTSHALRASAEPFLYRSIHWDWKHPLLERMLMLLRTLSDRPYVANYIWHVSMNNWRAPFQTEETIQIGSSDGDWVAKQHRFRPTLRWARMLVRAAKYPAKMEQEWVTFLSNGDEHAYATILLSLLHNLRSLRLDFLFVVKNGGMPGTMLHHSLFGNSPPGLLSRFTKLEMVDYGSNVPLRSFEKKPGYFGHEQSVRTLVPPSLSKDSRDLAPKHGWDYLADRSCRHVELSPFFLVAQSYY
jgi:hypothetical protein